MLGQWGGVCIIIGLFFFALLLGAIVLRLAIGFHNMLAGGQDSPSAAPMPSLGGAIGIVFVTLIVQAGVSFVVGLFAGGLVQALNIPPQHGAAFLQLLSVPVGFVVMGIMLSAMLPTGFFRGFLIAIFFFLVAIVISFVLSLAIAAALVGLGWSRPAMSSAAELPALASIL